MSIGATLAAARRRAGLTVGEVCSRTRIREGIIRGIERDDYTECGGDVYARGHVRSIARAVGADPELLISEYDAIREDQDQAQDQDERRAAGEFFRPPAAARTGHARPAERRRPTWVAVLLALALLGVLGFTGLRLVQAAGGQPRASAVRPAAAASRVHHHPARRQPRPVISHAAAAPAPPASTSRSLAPVSAQAFGPGGPAQGDDPQQAPLAIDASRATGWHTSWYTTPLFGNLQSGTGLLLDLGRPVMVSSAQLWLSTLPGADLELRAGLSPVLSQLPKVAGARGAAGLVRLRLGRPARARYVLVWFTRLPPDQAGTFQVSIYNVRLRGRG